MTKKIMVVDDSKLVRNAVIKSLQPDYDVIACESAESALKQIVEKKPDLILMDINLSGMNGIEAVKIIKNNDDTKHIPVIMLTQRNDTKNLLDSYSSGADDYLLKELTVKEVKNKVKLFLEGVNTKIQN